jgi:hypothetical protein
MENNTIKYTPQASVQASNVLKQAQKLTEQTKFNSGAYESGFHNDFDTYEKLKIQFESLQNLIISLGEMAKLDAQDALAHMTMHDELEKSQVEKM